MSRGCFILEKMENGDFHFSADCLPDRFSQIANRAACVWANGAVINILAHLSAKQTTHH